MYDTTLSSCTTCFSGLRALASIYGGVISTLSGKPVKRRSQRAKRKPEKLMILCSVMLDLTLLLVLSEDQSSGSEKAITVAEVEPLVKDFASRWKAAIDVESRAKGLVSEYQPKYNSARAVYKERKKYVDEIDWNLLAVPPSGSVKEELQWKAWKKFLAFEK
ncbi:hypothetical protein Tco_1269244 [Tanacetum coccineum]